MLMSATIGSIIITAATVATVATVPPAGAEPQGDQPRTLELVFESQPGFVIRGPDARHQLLVLGKNADDRFVDLTRQVSYQPTPQNIVSVSHTGLVTPLSNGQVTVTAVGPEGLSNTTEIRVEQFDEIPPINFPNQIVPIFTKLGCNGGGCHGQSGGQNGFRLSLLGFEPQEDHDYLVKEARGRRLFPAAPDNSLLLMKATNTIPHGGGQRIKNDSHEYRTLRRWIAQGMPYGRSSDPAVVRIQVMPEHRLLGRRQEQQFAVLAHYSDGSIADVTRAAQYDVAEKEMAQVSESGVVSVSDLPGDVVVMVRYLGHATVFRATVPLGADVTELPPPRNFIDEHVFAKLKLLGMPSSPICDDATFLRRVCLDITGRLPTAQETKDFLANPDPNKRNQWIDDLLHSPAYADYFANKWSAVLRNKRRLHAWREGTFSFHQWLRHYLYENVPYDELVRGVITATGTFSERPPVSWYRSVQERNAQMEDITQLFLGVRMQCAQCHHHPFEKWSQRDYYGMAAFFSQVGLKNGPQSGEIRIFHQRGVAEAENPKTKKKVKPTPLGANELELAKFSDPRIALADWMVQEDNPFFAHALVNRYWKHFFNRGLVHPEDDFRATNPASHPQLLEDLAHYFIDSGFDLKELIRLICQSTTYQLGSTTNDFNAKDTQNFSHYYPRRLHAEVLLDAIDTVTGGDSQFKHMPTGMRAVQIPDTGKEVGSDFLALFGRPEGASACECERTADANLAQSLHLLNSPQVQDKLSGGRAKAFAASSEQTDLEKVRLLYLLAVSRQPSEQELAGVMNHIGQTDGETKQHAYEDIIWALINTSEFLFNH